MAAKANSQPSELRGNTLPRLFTPPARPLTRDTTRGFEVADFANIIGEPLLPWQDWLVKHALELNPDGSFRFRVVVVLVARQNGKSSLKRTVSLWRMFLDAATVIGLAQDVALAREQWTHAQESVRASQELADEWGGVRNVNGDEKFWLTNGARYLIRAMNRKAGRGYALDEVNIDELREQRNWQAWSAVSKTTMARPNAQIWAMSNAGDDESVVLNQLREVALAAADPTIFIAEWSAPDGCDLDDPQAWQQANPGLGYIISQQAILSALATDPPEVFRTEVLCQKVDTLDNAIDQQAWRDCTDPTGTLDSVRERVVACIDVAEDSQHVTLAAAAVLDDGRVRTEIIRAWNGTDEARQQLAELLDRVQPRILAWPPTGPTAAIADLIRGPDIQQAVRQIEELKGADIPQACQGLADLVTARRIVHPGDPLLNAHVASARKLHQGDGWRFVRRGAGHVDAAYAAASATHIALTVPYVPKLRPLIIAGRRQAS